MAASAGGVGAATADAATADAATAGVATAGADVAVAVAADVDGTTRTSGFRSPSSGAS